MPKGILAGVEFEIDEDGFIQEPEKWSEAVAEDLAKDESSITPMPPDQWRLVNYIRDYYLQFGVAPPVRMLCKKNDFDLKYVYEMFPRGQPREPVKWLACPSLPVAFRGVIRLIVACLWNRSSMIAAH